MTQRSSGNPNGRPAGSRNRTTMAEWIIVTCAGASCLRARPVFFCYLQGAHCSRWGQMPGGIGQAGTHRSGSFFPVIYRAGRTCGCGGIDPQPRATALLYFSCY